MKQATLETIIGYLEEIEELLKLAGENPFKIRAFQKAITTLGTYSASELGERANTGTLTELDGIGKGIAEVLTEFLVQHKTSARDDLKKKLPPGLIELTQIPGLGPKKALQLIEGLEIHSLRELEYACRENRLLHLKGFGEKQQSKILDGILFLQSTAGKSQLGEILDPALLVESQLQKEFPTHTLALTGEIRRRLEIIQKAELLVSGGNSDTHQAIEARAHELWREQAISIPLVVHWSEPQAFGTHLLETTGSIAHLQALDSLRHPLPKVADEKEIYVSLNLPWIAPEMRETGEEISLAQAHRLPSPLQVAELRGFFHCHTTRSDGTASLEEMAAEAQRQGFEYFGVSDHSQSAFYAQGLKPDDVDAQKKELQKVRKQFPALRIFWGIESDILADGSLDYDKSTLDDFDFIIASIHSRFKMDRDEMTARIVRAIRNPATRFLGHSTGRLLLGREAYALDMERIIEEAAEHDVAIEINAHPARLDIDWRWGKKLRECGTRVCINPDAHSLQGIRDVRFGVHVANKALLPRELILNLLSAEEMSHWLLKRKD